MSKFIPAEPFDLVIFGGTGDLAKRKLLPALYHRDADGQLGEGSRIIASSRKDLTREAFQAMARTALCEHLPDRDFNEDTWARFADRLHHHRQDVTASEGWDGLQALLANDPGHIRVFYLATLPSLYGPAARNLSAAGLAEPSSRIVLEKPVGSDFDSARTINDEVGEYFSESSIFRIDHYLGKETVQNLMALRFANALMEPLWRGSAIDHVQITVAEQLGAGGRAAFYDRTGTLRDMLQNHMMQLLCLVAMEPPARMNHEDIRGEKIKVLRALRTITPHTVERATVRGQYTSGAVDGELVAGYLEELEGQASSTETFVAVKAEIDNWRWAGTPFYLRSGKRLAGKFSQIVIQFRPIAHSIFPDDAGSLQPNRLTIRLQPDEGVELSVMTKVPGPGEFKMHPLPLDLSFAEAYDKGYPDAYERLLMEVLRGDPALFMHRDEVECAWNWIDGIIDSWASKNMPAQPYVAGTWGPTDAVRLLDRDGREWFHPDV
ncbi:MAG: glucose-6-phosphate dehydrogenase [Gammaproteobacteria bacterium]|nr:glucose-6-phosphate dehydrogenase [Gammaproteobacteria bacterium]NNJ78401.1 glucose-6-phosphate dehydrogenase [Xanthomonadales bacterium]